MVILKGRTVILRSVKQSDLKLFRDWRNSAVIREFNTQFTLLNMVQQNFWFDSLSDKKKDKSMFTITEKKNTSIGICGLTNIDWKNRNASIAIIIGKPHLHSKGFGTESLDLLLEYGFKELKLHRIVADILEFNHKSIVFFEKFGFKLDAVFRDYLFRNGKWWKLFSYSKTINDD